MRLAEFITHEEQFSARMCPHISIEEAKVGCFLPFIPWHFEEHRAFAMYNFVMTQREHKVFIIIIHDAKRKFILLKFSCNGIQFEIIQRIMHPAHHPFHAKPETIANRGPANAWPVCSFFSNCLYIREIAVDSFIQVPDESDRFKVAIATMLVGLPFTFIP